MLTAAKGLCRIRAHYDEDSRYLFQVLLTATSVVEANIALDLLSKTVPDKALVAAINLREAIQSIPSTPFRMAVDEQTFMRIGGMVKDLAALSCTTPDGYSIVVTTAGNLVLDLIVKHDDEKHFWTPIPRTDDLVDPGLVQHLVESDHLFSGVVDVIKSMGVVFNPTLYLSVDDWHLEYARETIEGLEGLF
ncbi:MAG: hypothetical protein RQ731_07910 [Anaerosomatales bacterium]|nr:hypothetical protein [Anaerosomatales bacterium]MDT8434662.1 hypothetical protein [Anaerosomatales bacterium]